MRDAASMAHYLKEQNFFVDTIICSSAERAYSTANTLFGIIRPENKILVIEEIYNASVRNLMEIITSLEEVSKNAIIVGHNPYISYLAEYLTKADIGDMHPAGIAIIKFNIHRWNEVAEGNGSLEAYVHPAQIE
jgi:phosphohistidine phosphatase